MPMNPSDKYTQIVTDLVLLVESLTDTEAFFMQGSRGITVIVPAKFMPEVKAFCTIHQDVLGDIYFIPDDICYIPVSSIKTAIITATPAIGGVISKGMQ